MRRTPLMMALLLLALTACGGSAASPTGPAAGGDLKAQIVGNWRVTALNGAPLIPSSTITFQFEAGGQAGGKACNNIGGRYAISGDVISFSELTQTEMGCLQPIGVMDQEQRFGQTLTGAATARVEGDTLRLFDDAGLEVLTFERAQ